MNHEEFERKLRSHDPASHIEERDAHEHRRLLEHVLSNQPANVVPISKWSKRRKAVSAAAAALLVIGFGGPVISGSMSATPNRLVFGEAQNQANGQASDSALSREDSKMMYGYPGFWAGYHYELSGDVVSDLPTSALAYKFVNLPDLENRIKQIAEVLGVKNLDTSEDGTVTNSDVMTAPENFYSWTEPGQASFSYFNSGVDPWRDCYKEEPSRDSEPEVCEPIQENLPSNSEATAAAKKLLLNLGFDVSDMRFDVYENDYTVDVNAIKQINNEDSPINYYVSFVANSEIYSIGGSLTQLVEIGSYDLVSLEKAVARSNELTNRTIGTWNEKYTGSITDPGASEGSSGTSGSEGKSTDSGEASEPSAPSEDPSPSDDVITEEPIGPDSTFEPVTVTVTRAEIQHQMFWMEDGSTLWLPIVMFWGTTPDYDEEFQFGSIIAIVDSQIDLESLYSNWGVYPMVKDVVID